MISCNLNGVKRVLCLGAHSDDIEIGCGGTLLRMIEQSERIEFYWLVLCSNPTRAKEAKRSANADRKSTRLNSSHVRISYAVFCLKKKNMDVVRAVLSPELRVDAIL